jgi:hypothetical protein
MDAVSSVHKSRTPYAVVIETHFLLFGRSPVQISTSLNAILSFLENTGTVPLNNATVDFLDTLRTLYYIKRSSFPVSSIERSYGKQMKPLMLAISLRLADLKTRQCQNTVAKLFIRNCVCVRVCVCACECVCVCVCVSRHIMAALSNRTRRLFVSRCTKQMLKRFIITNKLGMSSGLGGKG